MISSHETPLFSDLTKIIGADAFLYSSVQRTRGLGFNDVAGGEIDNRLIDNGKGARREWPNELLLHALVAAVKHGEEQAEKAPKRPPSAINTSGSPDSRQGVGNGNVSSQAGVDCVRTTRRIQTDMRPPSVVPFELRMLDPRRWTSRQSSVLPGASGVLLSG